MRYFEYAECRDKENKTHTCFVVVKTAELLASAKPGHWGR